MNIFLFSRKITFIIIICLRQSFILNRERGLETMRKKIKKIVTNLIQLINKQIKRHFVKIILFFSSNIREEEEEEVFKLFLFKSINFSL